MQQSCLNCFYFFRIQILKTSFEKNIYCSVGSEENVFTSEVWWTSVLLILIIPQLYPQIPVLTFFPEDFILNIILMVHNIFLAFAIKFPLISQYSVFMPRFHLLQGVCSYQDSFWILWLCLLVLLIQER